MFITAFPNYINALRSAPGTQSAEVNFFSTPGTPNGGPLDVFRQDVQAEELVQQWQAALEALQG